MFRGFRCSSDLECVTWDLACCVSDLVFPSHHRCSGPLTVHQPAASSLALHVLVVTDELSQRPAWNALCSSVTPLAGVCCSSASMCIYLKVQLHVAFCSECFCVWQLLLGGQPPRQAVLCSPPKALIDTDMESNPCNSVQSLCKRFRRVVPRTCPCTLACRLAALRK